MDWSSEELLAGREIGDQLAKYDVSRRTTVPAQQICLSVDSAREMIEGVHFPSTGRLPVGHIAVRHLCRLLGFDEEFPFRWRLDHKLIQALVLKQFCPGCVPTTVGLQRYRERYIRDVDSAKIRQILAPYHLKRSYGYGARPECDDERSQAADYLATGSGGPVRSVYDEEWIIQEVLDIDEEYRVHTVEDAVVEDLTYFRHSRRPLRAGRDGPVNYVRSVLKCLPNAVTANVVAGWDIAKTRHGAYRVIELNLGGLYPGFRSGYRVSAYFEHAGGSVVIARLVRFIEEQYGVSIAFEYDGDGSLSDWYRSIAEWSELLRIARRVVALAARSSTLTAERDCNEPEERSRDAVFANVLNRLVESAVYVE